MGHKVRAETPQIRALINLMNSSSYAALHCVRILVKKQAVQQYETQREK